MELSLYNTTDSGNVINKNKELIYTTNIKLKNNVSVSNPSIVLRLVEGVDFFNCNYAYLERFKRFYHIRNIEVNNNHTFRLDLDCDVLESFKDDILNSYGEITRTVENGYYDGGALTEVLKEHTLFHSDVTNNLDDNVIVVMFGVNSEDE